MHSTDTIYYTRCAAELTAAVLEMNADWQSTTKLRRKLYITSFFGIKPMLYGGVVPRRNKYVRFEINYVQKSLANKNYRVVYKNVIKIISLGQWRPRRSVPRARRRNIRVRNFHNNRSMQTKLFNLYQSAWKIYLRVYKFPCRRRRRRRGLAK